MVVGARFDHIAIAVPDRLRAERTYVDALGAGRVALAHSGGIEIAQLRFGNGSKLELLSPYGDRTAATRLTEHLEQRPASIHHITLLVDALDNAVAALASANVRCVGLAEQPDGSREAFVLPGDAGGLLVQLVQKDIDDAEWARRHDQVVDDPAPGAAHFVGALCPCRSPRGREPDDDARCDRDDRTDTCQSPVGRLPTLPLAHTRSGRNTAHLRWHSSPST